MDACIALNQRLLHFDSAVRRVDDGTELDYSAVAVRLTTRP